MLYQLRLEPTAEQYLRRLPKAEHIHVKHCLQLLAEDPYRPGTQPVSSDGSASRRFTLVTRSQDDRAVFILYTVDPDAQGVTISHIGRPEDLPFDLESRYLGEQAGD